MKRAGEFVAEGRGIVVDIDLEKYFDWVNHDVLMVRLVRHVRDKRLLRIVRRILEAGMMWDGVSIERQEGTLQGGPLSPLLANLLLDDLDKELEKRGRRFCRYAADCNMYVRRVEAGEGEKAWVTRFVEDKLRLRVNEEKRAVALVEDRQNLGYRILAAGYSTAESGASQEADMGDFAAEQRYVPGAAEQRVEDVPDGVGDDLSLCSVQATPALAALCAYNR